MEQALSVFRLNNKHMIADDLRNYGYTSTATFRANPDQSENSASLQAAGIPHDISVERDYDVDPMTYYVRFNPDGTTVRKEIMDDDVVLPVYKLHDLLDKPDELRAMIQKRWEDVQVLPWDNQLEYSLPARVAARLMRSTS
jgi:hypothetical protein